MHDAPRPGSIPAAAEERAAFEAAILAMPGCTQVLLRRRDAPGSAKPGEYVQYAIQACWEVWQARAALAAPKEEAWNYPSAGQLPSPDEVVFCAWTTHQGGFEYDVARMNEYGIWGDPEDPHDTSYYPPAAWHRPAPPTSRAPQEESHD